MSLHSRKLLSNLALLARSKAFAPVTLLARRNFIGDYDKKKKLFPKDVTYKQGDDRFLKGPSYLDEPYIRPSDDEIVELTRLKLEPEIGLEQHTRIDPSQEPFNEVFKDSPDTGKYTQVEPVGIEGIWFWVERLMPKQVLPLEQTKYDARLGLPPLPASPPDLPYFIARTRSNVYPVYRVYKVEGRDHSTYWKNRWDGRFNKYHAHILENLDDYKHENNEKTIAITQINKVHGDIWRFEQDLRQFLEQKLDDGSNQAQPVRLLSSVSEANGNVCFKGDFVQDVVEFLQQKQF